jgi:hypothetical protein
VGRESVHAALDEMKAEQLGHYNFNCPHCGKSNHASRPELMRAAPDWAGKENQPQAQ